MPVSNSSKLGYPIPGATVNDSRLLDVQAIKQALVAIDNSINTAPPTGDLSTDFSAKTLTVSGDILPSGTSVKNIGSPANRFGSIYVDEAHLSVNTLYLGDVAVLGTNVDTVNISADPGQSINIKTTGLGSSLVSSEKGVLVTSIGSNGDVLVSSPNTGGQVRLSAAQSIAITAPETVTYGSATVTGNQTVTGNLTVTGNVTINGTTATVNATTVSTKDNIITVNSGQVGSGVSAGKAGIAVDRGDEPDYQMVFDEADDMFKVGMIGSLQTIASHNFTEATYAPIAHTHAAATTTVSGLMSAADKTKLDGVSGTNTGDETTVSIKTKLGVTTLSGSNTGDQVIPITLPASDVHEWAKEPSRPTYTAADVGLGNVDNTADAVKSVASAATVAYSGITGKPTTLAGLGISDVYTKAATDSKIQAIIGAAPEALDTLQEIAAQLASDESAVSSLITTVSGKADSAHVHSTATTSVDGFLSAADKTKLDSVAVGAGVTTVTSVAGRTGAVVLAKTDVGLSNVDNTSDVNKPISNATQTALAAKQDSLGFTPYNSTNPSDFIAASGAPVQSVAGKTGTVSLVKADVGLGNVDNTADSAKSVASAASVPFTGITGTPTTIAGYGITDAYNKTETDSRIQAVVGAAPAALDTLAEIATQLASDESAVSSLVTTVSAKADTTYVNTQLLGKSDSAHVHSSATTSVGGFLSATDKTKLDAITGTNTGDETLATIKTKLGVTTLSGSNTGDQVIPTTLPASDVSDWAKAATKPTYTATEVGLGNVNNTADSVKSVASAAAVPFTGVTGKPTTVAGYGITDAYTKTETDTRIQAVVGAAPAALDTLAEIATQLASDESAAAALTTSVSLKAATTYVDTQLATKAASTHTHAAATTSADGLMSAADKTKLNGVSGTNTGDETLATIKTKLGIATLSGSNTGDQVIPTTLPASDVYTWAKAATKPTYTASDVGLGSVENKSSATIRGEITSANVTAALGFTPANSVSPSAGVVINVITTNTTATAGITYILEAACTLTLPANPTVNDYVGFSNRSGGTACVIACNGKKIMGLAEDLTLDTLATSYGKLIYASATSGWVFV